jgi:aspartyl-tRNA(Asn)/glutamyl-tRNA(Gln) amidotransferase subunit C
MSLTQTDVERIAHLARIALQPTQAQTLAGDLSGILGHIEQMSTVNTQGITPMAHPLHMSQRLRPDVVEHSDERELFQSLAPQAEQGLYLVPKVIE